jgi:hypothetical protein
MDPYRWRKLSAIFNSAMSHPPEERSAFLRRACVDDSELRAEIESLIADDARTADWKLTTTIGNYRIERLLGSGGIGSVFLAHDSVLHRRVACEGDPWPR